MQQSILGPEAIEWMGVSYRTILSGKDSGGAMSVLDSVSPPGSGPPRHVHGAEDEAFIVLSGECEFWIAGRGLICGPGETAYVPRGTEHTFRVIGDRPSRHLVILTPGGFEAFFEEMAARGLRVPEDMDRIAAAGSRHPLSFTGPPLGQE